MSFIQFTFLCEVALILLPLLFPFSVTRRFNLWLNLYFSLFKLVSKVLYLLIIKMYPVQERIDMILIIGECEENCLLASRVYAQKYPERSHPDKRSFEKLLETFRQSGSVVYKKKTDKNLLPEMRKMNF